MSALTYNTTTEARRKLADLRDKAHGGRARERSGHLPRSLSSRPENTAKQESRKRLKSQSRRRQAPAAGHVRSSTPMSDSDTRLLLDAGYRSWTRSKKSPSQETEVHCQICLHNLSLVPVRPILSYLMIALRQAATKKREPAKKARDAERFCYL